MSSAPDFQRQAAQLLADELSNRGLHTVAQDEILSGEASNPRDQAALAVISQVLATAHAQRAVSGEGLRQVGYMDEGLVPLLPFTDSCVLSLRAILRRDPESGHDRPVFVPISAQDKDNMGWKASTDEQGPSPTVSEQEAFEAWAQENGYDMSTHPLHWLFLDEKTYAARQGWKAGLVYQSSSRAQSHCT